MPGANQPQLTRVLAQLVRNSFQTQHYLCSKSLFHYCSCGEEVSRRGGKRRDAQPVRHQAASQWRLAGMSKKHTCHILRGLPLFCLWIRDICPCLSLLGMKFTASLPLSLHLLLRCLTLNFTKSHFLVAVWENLWKSISTDLQGRELEHERGVMHLDSHAGIGL